MPVEVIIIAPLWVPIQVPGMSVRTFPSIDAFEDWRQGTVHETPLSPYVEAVLRELGVTAPALMMPLLSWLSEQASTPPLKVVERRWSSRRSFYRRWALPVSPAEFLTRIRRSHARALLAKGHTPGEAARAAGYGSERKLRGEVTGHNPTGM